MIDETGKSPDGPPTVIDLTYESRIRGSAAASQGLQGPLDGGWTVRTDSCPAIRTWRISTGWRCRS